MSQNNNNSDINTTIKRAGVYGLDPEMDFESFVQWVQTTDFRIHEQESEKVHGDRWKKLEIDTSVIDRAMMDNSLDRRLTDEEIMGYWKEVFLGNIEMLRGRNTTESRFIIHTGKLAKETLIKRLFRLPSRIASDLERGLRNELVGKRKTDKVDEYFQVGVLALAEAIDRYDPRKGALLTTYAYKYIWQSIVNYIYEEQFEMTISEHMRKQYFMIVRERTFLRKLLDRNPSSLEITYCLNFGRKKTVELIKNGHDLVLPREIEGKFSLATVSRYLLLGEPMINLDYRAYSDSDSVGETINAETTDRLNTHEKAELKALLERLIPFLSPLEALVVKSKFGLFGAKAMELKDIAEQANLSYERIRQLLHNALKILRDHPAASDLKDFYYD